MYEGCYNTFLKSIKAGRWAKSQQGKYVMKVQKKSSVKTRHFSRAKNVFQLVLVAKMIWTLGSFCAGDECEKLKHPQEGFGISQ